MEDKLLEVGAPVFESYRIHDDFYLFANFSKLGLSISKHCAEKSPWPSINSFNDKNWQSKCLAFKAMHMIDQVQLKSEDLAGGKEPGSIACKNHLGGEVIFAATITREGEIGSNQTICRFKDDSMVTVDSINTHLGRKKDQSPEAGKSK